MASYMDDNDQKSVYLYIYDMSKGMASAISPFLLGKQIPAIWHTGIVAYNKEYYFGSYGIECIEKGHTILGAPDKILPLGQTEVPYNLFNEYLLSLSESSFKAENYDLFEHNCNNFSQELATFLTGKSIPKEILDLPSEVLCTPLGQTVKLMLGQNINTGNNLFSFTPYAPKPISSHSSIHSSPSSGDSTCETNSEQASGVSGMLPDLNQHVPLTQTDVVNMINQYINSQVSAVDMNSGHLEVLDQMLQSSDEAKIQLTLSIISKASVKKDFGEVLKKAPNLMRGLKKVFDEGSVEVKKSVLELLGNLAESGIDWLMDMSGPAWIDEATKKAWTHKSATVAIIVAGLLEDPHLHEAAIKLAHDLSSRREDLEEEATEMTTALLQCLQTALPTEKNACMALESIVSLMNACPSEVPGLLHILAPDLNPLSELSSRSSELVSQLRQTSTFYLNC